MTIGPWLALVLTVPVLLLGERAVRLFPRLSRFCIPVPVVGGLTVAGAVLAVAWVGVDIGFDLSTSSRVWNWPIYAEPLLHAAPAPAPDVYTPLMVAFFASVGLNASWSVVRRGTWGLVLFLLAITGLMAVQVAVGVTVAAGLGQSPLLGLLCGAISMTGGHATSAAFAPLVEDAGLTGALDIAMAAATFGLVAGGLLGGPLGTVLIRKRRLATLTAADSETDTKPTATTFLGEICALIRARRAALTHALVLLTCLKLGAWVSFGLEQIDIAGRPVILPGYIGAMAVGVLARNLSDLVGRGWIESRVVSLWMFVCLDLFLAAAVMSLDLAQLAEVALPMLVILLVQVAVMAVYAALVTFRMMGSDYDAALMSAGHCGFGLGATPNAVANMEALAKRFGPAPRAFLILPFIGGFVSDFPNALIIGISIHLLG